jgi:hypothetical protein
MQHWRHKMLLSWEGQALLCYCLPVVLWQLGEA